MEEVDQEENQGNFIEMARFRAETDDILSKYLDHAPRNVQYTSKNSNSIDRYNWLPDLVRNHTRN